MLPDFRRDRLAAARQAAGLTETQLAAAVGVTLARVRAWESGRTPATRPKVIPRLAAALGVPALELLDVDTTDPRWWRCAWPASLSAQVAASLGVAAMTYQRLEVGSTDQPPSREMAERIAAVLGVEAGRAEAALRRSRAARL